MGCKYSRFRVPYKREKCPPRVETAAGKRQTREMLGRVTLSVVRGKKNARCLISLKTHIRLATISSSTNVGNWQFEWIWCGLPDDHSGLILPCSSRRKSHFVRTFAFGLTMECSYWSTGAILSSIPTGSNLPPLLTSWLVPNSCWKLRLKLPAFWPIYGCWFSRIWNYISELNTLYLNTPRLCLYKYYSNEQYHVERFFLGVVLHFGSPNQSFSRQMENLHWRRLYKEKIWNVNLETT